MTLFVFGLIGGFVLGCVLTGGAVALAEMIYLRRKQ